MERRNELDAFWQTYSNAMNWIKASNLRTRNEYLKALCNNPLFCPQNRPEKDVTCSNAPQPFGNDKELIYSNQESDESESIDPEYLQFAIINRLHRIERAKKKAIEQEQLKRTEYVELNHVERRYRLLNSTCASNRAEKLHELYGSMADQVANAESKLQCVFNTFCDQHQPPFWPQIPINLNLNDYKLT